jgi:hypothetical protein
MNDTDLVAFFFLGFCGLLILLSLLVAWKGKSLFE